jgi:hypothetical protein
VSNDHGGWQWHINEKQDIELELNDDNSVLSSVDFKAKAVMKSGDPTAQMAFHFAKEFDGTVGISSHTISGSLVNPGLRPAASEPDTKLLELQEVFNPLNTFRNPRSPNPEIEFSIRFKTITIVECGARFSTEIYTEDPIGSHACLLEATVRVTNGIPLGCPHVLPGGTVNCV